MTDADEYFDKWTAASKTIRELEADNVRLNEFWQSQRARAEKAEKAFDEERTHCTKMMAATNDKLDKYRDRLAELANANTELQARVAELKEEPYCPVCGSPSDVFHLPLCRFQGRVFYSMKAREREAE